MVICPVAIVAGCAKCPLSSLCPLKTVVGDARRPAPGAGGATGAKARTRARKKKQAEGQR